MLPLNPHELKKLLKRYGVDVEELRDVNRVELYTGSKKIIIDSPQVIVFKASNQTIFQVTGRDIREEQLKTEVVKPIEVKIREDDVEFIVEQTGVSREKAVEALIKAGGDVARAIMIIRGGE